MQKFVTAIVALACLLGGGAWALWVVPPADPVDYVRFHLTHDMTQTVGVTTAEAADICPLDMTLYRAACVDHLTHPHFAAWESRTRLLSEVQAIPDDDCARMAAVLIERRHLRSDGEIVKNARGDFNCDFTRHGLTHVIWPERTDYSCNQVYGVDLITPPMSRPDYEACMRRTYVTRPVYNLSRTRFSIEDGGPGAGEQCVYTRLDRNRLTDRWRLERCVTTWVF